jgi:protein-S-isoprenylcysteine O-methyltransferase Ste14
MRALDLKIPPVALTAIFALLMWLIAASVPALSLALPWRAALALMSVAAGFAVALAGVIAFRRAKTTVSPLTPETTSAMVTSGVYGVSRNPMYVGFLLVLIGWAAFLSHALAFALLPLFVAYMNRFQIEPEERALSAKFGGQFQEYRRSVRRWV